jgi:small subunit ribosomal protein S5
MWFSQNSTHSCSKVKQLLRLAGIEDIWSKTFGDTRTSENLVKATFNALKNAHKFSFNI